MKPAEFLVTGGNGKTGRRLAARLRAQEFLPRVATRRVQRPGEVRFDWSDPGSFKQALDGISAVYLVAPPVAGDTLEAVRPFIDEALSEGIKRFVLLSASSLEEGGPMMGAVHAYLRAHAPQWVVLRPTWFMQNFSEQQHLPTIRDEGIIYSATGEGKIAFIDANDIAAVAAQVLTNEDFPNGDLILTGPQPLSYDEVAAILSEELGRPIVHRSLTETELAERLTRGGLPSSLAQTLAAMDTGIAGGSEQRTTDNVRAVTGQAPGSFRDFVKANVAVWRQAFPRTETAVHSA